MNNLDNWQVKQSTRKNKKYMARFNGGEWQHFGDTRYEQYFDRTPLKLYSHLNHKNKLRRELYKLRHKSDLSVVGTPGWLADKFLW